MYNKNNVQIPPCLDQRVLDTQYQALQHSHTSTRTMYHQADARSYISNFLKASLSLLAIFCYNKSMSSLTKASNPTPSWYIDILWNFTRILGSVGPFCCINKALKASLGLLGAVVCHRSWLSCCLTPNGSSFHSYMLSVHWHFVALQSCFRHDKCTSLYL